MINNYFNIPSIPCNARENIDNKTDQEVLQLLKCQGLNPDNVFSTLYPSSSNPLINYTTYSQKNLSEGKLLSQTRDNLNKCATDCTKNKDCTYFTLKKQNNQCLMYSQDQTSKNNQFKNLTKNNKLTTFRKNTLLEGTQTCDPKDNFISQPTNFFPDVKDPSKTIQTVSQPGLTQNECLSLCMYDSECKSVVFAESENQCKKFNTNNNNINLAISSQASPVDPDASTYVKNRTIMPNRFEAPDNLESYYQKYPKKGKVGDSFCEYVNDTCKTSYVVGKNGKEIPKDGGSKKPGVPTPRLCIPPKCVPTPPKTGLRGKLKINGNISIACPPGDKECEKRISETPYYEFDQMGLPTDAGTANPPNSYLPFTAKYNQYKNLTFGSEIQEMVEKPDMNGYDFPEGCESWCTSSQNCGGFTYRYGADGKAKCKYFDNAGMPQLLDSLKYLDGTNANIKRGNPLVQDPDLGDFKKPYFNNFDAKSTKVKKQKVCVRPPSQSESSPTGPFNPSPPKPKLKKCLTETFANHEDFGMCPDKVTQKLDSWGSNCPTLTKLKCSESEYGCCPDKRTPKINQKGDNCPIISKDECLKSKHGCCTGTIIPKEYLCNCEEEEECDTNLCISNCELSPLQTGDPYAFGNAINKTCKNNTDCGEGYMCVGGYCKPYNVGMYNGLNDVMHAGFNTRSNLENNNLCGNMGTKKISEECPKNYEPVCGVDGKTYRNNCVAKNSGVETKHYGACGKEIMVNFFSGEDLLITQEKGYSFFSGMNLVSILIFVSLIIVYVLVHNKKIDLKKFI